MLMLGQLNGTKKREAVGEAVTIKSPRKVRSNGKGRSRQMVL